MSPVSRVVVGLLLLDGVLAVLLAGRVVSEAEIPSVREAAFLAALALDGAAGIGLLARRPWAVPVGIVAAAAAVAVGLDGLLLAAVARSPLGAARFLLRVLVSGFVLHRLWVAWRGRRAP